MARFCFFDEIRNLEDDIFPLLSSFFFFNFAVAWVV